MLPKLILTDIDGVWTDGGMFYDELGNEFKKFHTYDSAGVLFCKILEIPIGIITGENVKSVKRRAEKLKVEHLYLGIKEKVKVIQNLINELNINWDEVAYIGDDINDYSLLKKVGLSACPSSAPNYMKEIVDWQLYKKGGEGVFREFVEKILSNNNIDVVNLLKDNNLIKEYNQ
ncbi:KdsC family phosphatase [Polaribacter sp. Hel1_85]|uniref:KdsC family phosphatase n=1 Tax=Polaribacter sp. Hel1_85 TaxID=1250005 RepID=UPI00052CD0DA|nr:HAD-IIIA family hydrolase [Polaribacter sp. Hel1_85]KGL62086.1 3-deoxy-D-manno-octulosonate 8-phosphate phosphatase [Polaribacter sp. Hel1_85]